MSPEPLRRVVLARILVALAFSATILLSPQQTRADEAVSIAIATDPNPNYPSELVTVSVQLTPNPGGGTVTLREYSGGVWLDRETVSVDPGTGAASFTPQNYYSAATTDLRVAFSGAPGYSASTSATYVHNTQYKPLDFAVTMDPSPSYVGEYVDVEIALDPNPEQGYVHLTGDGLSSTSASWEVDPATGIASGTLRFTLAGTNTVNLSYFWVNGFNDYRGEAIATQEAVYQYDTTTAFELGGTLVVPGASVGLTATVDPIPPSGQVRFHVGAWSQDVAVSPSTGIATATYNVPTGGSFSPGDVQASAEFLGYLDYAPSSSAAATLQLRYPANIWVEFDVNPVTAGEQPHLPAYGRAFSSSGYPAPSGVMTFFVDDVEVGTATISGTYAYPSIPTPSVGSHVLRATYAGSGTHMPAASVEVPFEVLADTSVQLRDVTISQTKFFPKVDNYRDTTRLAWTLDEAARVSVKAVRVSNGSVVRRWSLGKIGPGDFSLTWNGKNADGAFVRAGAYKLVLTANDLRDNTKTVSKRADVDLRVLVKRTYSVTRNAASFDAKGRGGNASITAYSDGSVKLAAGRWEGLTPTGWAGIGFQFRAPAAVSYVSGKFSIQADAPLHAPPILLRGVQNWNACPYRRNVDWNTNCFDINKTFSVSRNIAPERYVRGIIYARGGTVWAYKVTLKVVYKVLV